MFASEFIGGAELTTQALIDSSPFNVAKIRSKDVTEEFIRKNANKFWIIGNFSQLNPECIQKLMLTSYSILEFDYKYCTYRSPEKHAAIATMPCDCHNKNNGKFVESFYNGSMGLWWMSKKQEERYTTAFPVLCNVSQPTLSSVFDIRTLDLLRTLRMKYASVERLKWVVLGSDSWIKGSKIAIQWCKDSNKQYEVISNLPYEQMLEKLASAKGLVYLPRGGDTCPRLVIEAKLLGCELHLNDNVQHKDEEWFATNDLEAIDSYLRSSPERFWNSIRRMIDNEPTISGYTTTYNCIDQQYPYKQCISSMLAFCDEVCIVDGGSIDGTWDELLQWNLTEPKLIIKQIKRDWSSKRHPVFDGMQKAEARKLCTSKYCWQQDSDEIVHENDAKLIAGMCKFMPSNVDIMALPVIEYWGSADKVRCDVTPWKWRLSRNKLNITHGIPKQLRRTDENDEIYAAQGTDGCDMIDSVTGLSLPLVNFYNQQVESCRMNALRGDDRARVEYERWFNDVVNCLPSIFHYSWFDLSRKIRLYRDYWQNHWRALYDQDTSDTAQNNMFFDLPWSEVTDEMIDARAEELTQIGGHIWHSKYNGERTPWITCGRIQPKVML
jgi:glycosyltransferase involved in cell wall biosynthesis